MRYDRTHLELHRRQWRVRIAVPKDLKPIIGKPHVVVALGTESLSEAAQKKHAVIAGIRKSFDDARKGVKDIATNSTADWIEEAMVWRDKGVTNLGTGERDEELTQEFLIERAQEIDAVAGWPEAKNFLAVAKGEATPFLPLLDRWLGERISMKPRQKHDYRRAVTKFGAFHPTLAGVTRRKVGDYVSVNFLEKGIHPRTTNKEISCLSSFWQWLEKRGFVEGQNPWRGQGVSVRDLESVQIKKRPFKDGEVSKLVAGADEGTMLGDAIRIGALSGMRVSEIAKLRVSDIVDGCFAVVDAKTKAGNRTVPVHSAIRSLVEARMKGKEGKERLFDELPLVKPGSAVEPGQAITKKFGRMREKLGVDEKDAGARQSNIDFHSFRRWFITKAEMAGVPPHIISSVVGHERAGMTLGVYSGGPSGEQMRACVEAVRLPTSLA